ncbi:MAG TPA: spore coat U domain-containing protein [Methylomirabilota bacterium]|jgi:spore coat protein U-like protein
MSRSLRIAVILAGLALGTTVSAVAQTDTDTFNVSTNVSKNCSITTSPVAFGVYDPVVANATTPLDATGAVIVTCTKGAGTRINLNNGSNATGGNRRMSAGGGNFLTYQLYQDSGRTTTWGSGASAGQTVSGAPSKAPRTFTVFGRVPAGQDVPAGSYTDTVVATIQF